MKNRWMRGTCLALAALMLLGCTACGNRKEEKVAFAPRLDTGAQVELRTVGFLGNFEALDQVVNAFNAYYPNVSVLYESVDSESLGDYVDNNPQVDIFMTADKNVRYSGWGKRYVGDFCADLKGEELDLGAYRQDMLTECTIDGKLVRLPLGMSLCGMVVNETLLKKEGLPVPKNYKEFLSVLESLKEKGYTPIQGAANAVYSYLCRDMILCTLEEKNLLKGLNQGDAAAVDAMIPAFERAKEIFNKGYTDPELNETYPNDNYDGAILRFLEGDVPFWICDTEKVSGMRKRESKSESFTANPFEYSFRAIPMGDNGPYQYLEPWYGFSLNSGSQNYDYAAEFLRFLATTDQLNTMASVKGIPSASAAPGEDARYRHSFEAPAENVLTSKGEVYEYMKSFLINAVRDLAAGAYDSPRAAAQGYLDACSNVEK